MQFFATDGTLQNPNITGITIVDTDKLIGTKLTTGTLNIEKSKDGKTYTLTHLATPATKLDINYNDLSDVIDYADTNNFITTEYPFSVTNKFFDIADTSFSEMNEAQKTVTKLETKLYDLEREKTSYKSKDAYLKFMTYISNVDVTDVADKLISDVEITESITELEDSTMLG